MVSKNDNSFKEYNDRKETGSADWETGELWISNLKGQNNRGHITH